MTPNEPDQLPSWSELAQSEQINELLIMVSKLAKVTEILDMAVGQHEDRIKTLELSSEV